jgi:hypothetical protein
LALVAHACYPGSLGGWDWHDCSSRPTQANSLWDSHLQNNRAKCTGGLPQVVKCLLCKHKALNSNSNPTKKKKKIYVQYNYTDMCALPCMHAKRTVWQSQTRSILGKVVFLNYKRHKCEFLTLNMLLYIPNAN